MHRRVVSSLQALAHPDWTNAVVGTAAAIALESATAACATQLISEVTLCLEGCNTSCLERFLWYVVRDIAGHEEWT